MKKIYGNDCYHFQQDILAKRQYILALLNHVYPSSPSNLERLDQVVFIVNDAYSKKGQTGSIEDMIEMAIKDMIVKTNQMFIARKYQIEQDIKMKYRNSIASRFTSSKAELDIQSQRQMAKKQELQDTLHKLRQEIEGSIFKV